MDGRHSVRTDGSRGWNRRARNPQKDSTRLTMVGWLVGCHHSAPLSTVHSFTINHPPNRRDHSTGIEACIENTIHCHREEEEARARKSRKSFFFLKYFWVGMSGEVCWRYFRGLLYNAVDTLLPKEWFQLPMKRENVRVERRVGGGVRKHI